jgi:hypothetical protein
VNNNEVVNTDTFAAGLGTFTLQLTDAGSPTQGVTTKIFTVQFDQPNTNIPKVESPVDGSLDGDGLAYWITNDYVGLTNNLVSSLGNSTAFIDGLTPVTLANNPIATTICPAPTVSPPTFHNEKISNALTAGTFYVYITVLNSKGFQTNPDVALVHRRYSISYRPDSNSAWTTAVDINNNTAVTAATWTYNSSKAGWDSNQNQYTLGNASDTSITVSKQETNPVPQYGALVFAFDQPGEYRIICGNLSSIIQNVGGGTSTFGWFYNSINCGGTRDFDLESTVFTGDFYYPDQNPIGQLGETVFRYEVDPTGTCSDAFTPVGGPYYAREPLAKYVTLLYTDQALTNSASNVDGNAFRYRKMQDLNPIGTIVSNPEYTKDGAYVADFSTGMRVSNSTPCLY